ncbi:hypothetical protein YC2023_045229 [Brassica napus]
MYPNQASHKEIHPGLIGRTKYEILENQIGVCLGTALKARLELDRMKKRSDETSIHSQGWSFLYSNSQPVLDQTLSMHKASRRRSDHALTLHNLARTLHNPKTPQMVELCTLGLSRSVQVRTGPYQSTPLDTPKALTFNLRMSCPILAQDSISTQHFTTPFLFFKLTLPLKLDYRRSLVKLGTLKNSLIKNLTKENPLGQNLDEGKRVEPPRPRDWPLVSSLLSWLLTISIRSDHTPSFFIEYPTSTKEWNHEPDHGELVAVEEPTLEECLSRNKASIIRDNLIYIQATLHSS